MKRHTTFKLVLRLLLVGAVILTVAGFTMAMWSDGATSNGNVFATGCLDLKVRPDGGEFWVDGPVYATWGANNMFPGQDLNWGAINFRDCGTLDGSTFDISVANTCSAAGMDEFVQITRMEYADDLFYDFMDTTKPYALVDFNGNGWRDLDDLEHLPRLGLSPPGTSGQLLMDFRFNENAGNSFGGGENVVADFTFTLHQ